MQLMDKGVLLRALQRKKPGQANKRYVEGYNDAIMVFRSMVHSAPIIDADPVSRGKWIIRKSWDKFVCSCCSFEENHPTKYCPNCGAKMGE